jgi:GTPase SAR1 family protein
VKLPLPRSRRQPRKSFQFFGHGPKLFYFSNSSWLELNEMGCSPSTQSVQPKDMNAADVLLKEAEENERFNMKVLMLGAGESGKSTVVKQIQLIGNVHESTSDRMKYRSALRRNIIEAIQVLLQASETLKIPIADEKLAQGAKEIMSLDNTNSNIEFSTELATLIDALWKTSEIQQVYERRDEYWLMDATPYYLTEVFRIAASDFDATEEDIIMARVRTTGIVVTEVIEKPYKYQIVDVGGQRSERRKWIHCFDDVKAIIYLASLSGYNQGMLLTKLVVVYLFKYFFNCVFSYFFCTS